QLLVGGESETAKLRAHFTLRQLRPQVLQRLDRGDQTVQFLELMLREIARYQLARPDHLARHRVELADQKLGQRRLAVAVLAQERDAVVRIEAKGQARQDRLARLITDCDAVQR